MAKPRPGALDLADHDVVEDDCDLVVGPLTARFSTGATSGRQVTGASFKGTSILGSPALAAKLSSSASVPAPPGLARKPSEKHSSNGVYCEGTPIIATASPTRPTSAALLQARLSAPCGGSGSNGSLSAAADAQPSQSRPAHGGRNAGKAASESCDGGLEGRMQGDIQGGDSDDSSTPNNTEPLQKCKRSSSRKAAAAAKSPAAKPHAAGVGDAQADLTRAAGTGAAPAQAGTPKRVSSEGGRAGALPSVDVDPERRQRLPRGLNGGDSHVAAPVVAVQPKSSAAVGKAAGASTASAAPLEGSGGASSFGRGAPALQAGRSVGSDPPSLGAIPERAPSGGSDATGKSSSMLQRSPSGRFLSRLLTGSHVSPGGAEKVRQQDGRKTAFGSGDEGCDGLEGGLDRKSSGGGGAGALRNLFSRPPSARRKSEVGGATGPGPLLQQQQQQQQQEQKAAANPRQLRHSHHGQTDAAAEEARTAAASIGGGRQPSGILKRTASAIASAWAR